MRKTPKEAFDEWFDEDQEQNLFDTTGGDWDDNVTYVRLTFQAGWEAALQNLTTRDI